MAELSSRSRPVQLSLGLLAVFFIALLLIAKPVVEQRSMTVLDKIQLRGTLQILTLNGASTYFQGKDGPNGFEFQLASLFSQFIGVKPEFITVSQFSDLYPALLYGSGDIIAAGMSANEPELSGAVAYGPWYFESTHQVLYRNGSVPRPREISDLIEGQLQVVSGTSQVRLLTEIQQQHPTLAWLEIDDVASDKLIEQVDSGEVTYLLADSHQIALQRRFFPELRIAFELGEPRQLRWAFNQTGDASLANAMDDFFEEIRSDGTLEQLVHRHYSHVAEFNYSDIQTFTGYIRERLPKYEAFFRREANAVGIDWRLLASIGYQESLWNSRAKSPTGVRGLMMLTQATAQQMGITNRLDPAESIRGGARYFARMLQRISPKIPEPDRTWLALASYNVGFGHVQDARKLTEQRDGDPNRWIDVKKTLPLLAQEQWYVNTKYGYARGWEPVEYVENIRTYYEYLTLQAIRSNPPMVISSAPLTSSEAVTILAPSL